MHVYLVILMLFIFVELACKIGVKKLPGSVEMVTAYCRIGELECYKLVKSIELIIVRYLVFVIQYYLDVAIDTGSGKLVARFLAVIASYFGY